MSDTNPVIRHLATERQDERLLAGDAPTGDDAAAAALVQALRQPAHAEELAGTEVLVARMARVACAAQSPAVGALPRRGRRAMVRRILTAKAAALAAAALVGAGAVAAATGTLPGPVEDGLAKIGIHVSRDDDSTTTPSTSALPTSVEDRPLALEGGPPASTDIRAGSEASTTASAVGPDATGPAKKGLCTAFRTHGQKNMEATAFKNLLAAATKAGQTIEQFCADVPGPGNSGSNPSDTAPGQTGSSPSDTAPGQTGSSPSDTAPGQTGSSPSDTAPGQTDDEDQPGNQGNSGSNPSDTAPGQDKGKGNDD